MLETAAWLGQPLPQGRCRFRAVLPPEGSDRRHRHHFLIRGHFQKRQHILLRPGGETGHNFGEDHGIPLRPHEGHQSRLGFGMIQGGDPFHGGHPYPLVRLGQLGDQGGPGLRSADFRQSLHGLLPDGVVFILRRDLAELLYGGIVLFGSKRLDRAPAALEVRLELALQQFRRRGEVPLGQDGEIRVQPHHLRLGRQREVKGFLRFADGDRELLGFGFSIHRHGKPHRHRQAEEQHFRIHFLRLPDRHPGLFGFGIPGIVSLQFRHPAVMHPLVEKLIQRTAAHFLHDVLQVIGGHDAVAVAFDVEADRFLISGLAQLAAQHMQHPCPFWIGPAVELLHRLAVVTPDDGPPVLGFNHPVGRLVQAGEEAIAAILFLLVKQRVITGEALIEPQVSPVAAGQQIPEPLVRHLMRIQPMQGIQPAYLLRKQQPARHEGTARILHAAGEEVVAIDLVVFVPGKRHADFLLEKCHHRRGIAEGQRRLGLLGRRDQQSQRQGSGLRFQLGKMTGREGNQVVHMRLFLLPMPRRQTARPGGPSRQAAIGNNLHALGHMAGHLAGEPFVRVIITGKPVAVVLRLALAPDLGIPGRITLLRSTEVQAIFRLSMIGNGDTRLLAGLHRGGEVHQQLVLRHLPVCDLHPGRGDLIDRQIHRIQRESAQRLCDGGKGNRHRPPDRAGLEIRSDVQRQMVDIHQPVAGIFAARLDLPAHRQEQVLLPAISHTLFLPHREGRGQQGRSDTENVGFHAGRITHATPLCNGQRSPGNPARQPRAALAGKSRDAFAWFHFDIIDSRCPARA